MRLPNGYYTDTRKTQAFCSRAEWSTLSREKGAGEGGQRIPTCQAFVVPVPWGTGIACFIWDFFGESTTVRLFLLLVGSVLGTAAATQIKDCKVSPRGQTTSWTHAGCKRLRPCFASACATTITSMSAKGDAAHLTSP